MARSPKIRITKNDRTEYARLAKNAKAKIKRTFKNHGIDLRNEIQIPDLETFQTRKEYNEWKEKAESFTNRNNQRYQFKKNKYGVSASKSLLNQIERDTKTAQRLAEKKIQEASKLPVISGGKKQVGGLQQRLLVAGKQQNVLGYSRPNDFNFDAIQSFRQLMERAETAKKKTSPEYYDERSALMKENFMDILRLSFNSNADELVDKITLIPADDFYAMYLMFDEFDFALYDSEGQDVDADEGTIEQMLSYVDAYRNGELDDDLLLKGFPNK